MIWDFSPSQGEILITLAFMVANFLTWHSPHARCKFAWWWHWYWHLTHFIFTYIAQNPQSKGNNFLDDVECNNFTILVQLTCSSHDAAIALESLMILVGSSPRTQLTWKCGWAIQNFRGTIITLQLKERRRIGCLQNW